MPAPIPAAFDGVERYSGIVEAVAAVAAERGVSQAQIALAWLRRHDVVAAPVVGAIENRHIKDAIASA